MQALTLLVTLAILTEGIIEYLGASMPSFIKPYAAALLSMAVCVIYDADLLKIMDYHAIIPYAGPLFTGLVIGRGSNYVNDLVSRLKVIGAPATMVDQVGKTPAAPVAAVSLPQPAPIALNTSAAPTTPSPVPPPTSPLTQ